MRSPTRNRPVTEVTRTAPAPARPPGPGLTWIHVTGGAQACRTSPDRENDHDVAPAAPELRPTGLRALHRAAQAHDADHALAHRALAADRPDPALAAALEDAALNGQGPLGARSVATRQLLVWAADLSTTRAQRERRLLLAALHEVYEGVPGNGTLWTRIETLPPSPLRCCALAGRALLQGRLRTAGIRLQAARDALAATTAPPAPGDGDGDQPHAHPRGEDPYFALAAIETLAAALACRTARGTAAVDAAGKALNAASRDTVQTRTARRLMLIGHSYTAGPREVLAALGEQDFAVTAPATVPVRPPEHLEPELLLLRGESRLLVGEFAAGTSDLECLVQRHTGHRGHPVRLRALERLALAHFLDGNWQGADDAVERIDAAGGGTAGQALRTMLLAARGSATTSPPSGTPVPAHRRAFEADDPERLVIAVSADAIGLLARRRYADVLRATTPLTDDSHDLHDAPQKFAPLWLPARAEAMVETAAAAAGARAGATAEVEAEASLDELRRCGGRSPHLMATFHRLAGRAAEYRQEPALAEREYRAGLWTVTTGIRVPRLEVAQIEHAYGRFLCSLGRSAEGRGRLQRAQDIFVSLGAFAFARRGEHDISAAAPVASRPPFVDLTEREAEVARLVSAGLTNRRVAEELLISAKAVEYHLGKIYPKLGVRTRGELTNRWPG